MFVNIIMYMYTSYNNIDESVLLAAECGTSYANFEINGKEFAALNNIIIVDSVHE